MFSCWSVHSACISEPVFRAKIYRLPCFLSKTKLGPGRGKKIGREYVLEGDCGPVETVCGSWSARVSQYLRYFAQGELC